jgi:riboflavin kinase / FMN adenylyltransferase
MIEEYRFGKGFAGYKANEPLTLCLGFFDGLHRGHLHLIEEAMKEKGRVGVLTFDGSLKFFTAKRDSAEILTTVEDRSSLLEKLGIHALFIVNFDKEIMSMKPEEFIALVLKPLNIRSLYVGSDFTFGQHAQGNIALLEKYFAVHVVDFILDEEGQKISATSIYSVLKEGNIVKANSLLGRPYSISGEVIKGLGNGMKMGFPTSNLKLSAPYVLPPLGVYATYSEFNEDGVKHLSMTDIGYHPTIDRLEQISIETNIFDIHEETYGKKLRVSFLDYIRPEMRFLSLNDLIRQLNEDKKQIQAEYKAD